MIRVKICGLVRRDDMLGAVEAGADALGFVFASGSPRRADPEVVATIVPELPDGVAAIGVFRDQCPHYVRDIAAFCRLDAVQLHGREDAEYIQQLGLGALQVVTLGRAGRSANLALGRGPFLLDGERPGSGQTVDWSQARRIARCTRLVLAGGLDPLNVGAAVSMVRPWGVDASSGLESSPGCKDGQKMRAFVARARAADARAADACALGGSPRTRPAPEQDANQRGKPADQDGKRAWITGWPPLERETA
jgi:phosphoribosylanthranilate isomerase